jgi:hypothetical protein
MAGKVPESFKKKQARDAQIEKAAVQAAKDAATVIDLITFQNYQKPNIFLPCRPAPSSRRKSSPEPRLMPTSMSRL